MGCFRFPRIALLASLVLVPLLPAATPFPQESSDLRADPATRFGTLDNGVRYVVRPNQEPRGRASLRLLVQAGSLNETESQRGIAHFLEHMAFNGSVHYPPGTLIEYFQRLGMNFGGDTNASTGFDRTQYYLELPDTRAETLHEGFQVLADYAGGLLLLEPEIEQERGVILSEKRARDSVEYRTAVAGYEFELGGTLFPVRMPIGEADVIENATREDFLAFYDTWYQPDRMTVVVVGDIDPDAVIAQIGDEFGSLTSRAPAPTDPDYGPIKATPGLRTAFHHEAEAASTGVAISTLIPHEPEPDTAARQLRELPRDLALAMLDRRFEILAKQEDAPFTSAQLYDSIAFDYLRSTGIELSTQPANWQAALAVAEQELRRALTFGFQEAELVEAVANYRNGLEQAVRTAPTRRSSSLAGSIASSLFANHVFTAPDDDLALLGPALDQITVEECNEALRTAWDVDHRNLMVTGNAPLPEIPDPSTEAVEAAATAAYEASAATPVEPPAAVADQSWAYTDFGPPGEVASREEVEDLGITLVTFANGVRLNLKRTDFEAQRIRINLRVGSGVLTEPRDQPGLADFAGSIFSAGGLGLHSADDLDRILAGRNVGFGFRVSSDALNIGATTTPDDLDLQMQLIAAYLTDPGYRPEAERQARKRLEESYTSLEHTINGPLQLEVTRRLASGDSRFGLATETEMAARTVDQVRDWLTPQLQGAPIEIAVAGDIDIDATIAAVARTIGSLPQRADRAPFTAERRVTFPAGPATWSYTVPTEIEKGVVAVYWPTTDDSDISRTRRLSLLGEVLSDRLRVKVREELGGAYSPGAGNSSSDTFTDYGMMIANVVVDPGAAPVILEAVQSIAEDIRANGVTEDEVLRAREPLLTSIRESARTNSYWLGSVLEQAQERPEVLDWSRSRESDFASITAADLSALAATYLRPDRAISVIVLPEGD